MVKLTPVSINEIRKAKGLPPVDEDPVEPDYTWEWNFTTNVCAVNIRWEEDEVTEDAEFEVVKPKLLENG